MKPRGIFSVMDLAWECHKNNNRFVPLFTGPPGIAKSYNVQKWAELNGFKLIDIRLAVLEQGDFIGLPTFKTVDGSERTIYSLPEFWPTGEEKCVLFFDEPNRGTNAIMNGLMQVLTDGRIHTYKIPKNCLIVAACNPEDGDYEVNSMDTALKDRFIPYEIEYDRQDFVQFMTEQKWNSSLISFVESGAWTYVKPEHLSGNAGTKYLSPRSLEKLNNALKTKAVESIMLETFEAVLGRAYASEFYAFLTNERPVTFADLVKNRREAISRLKKFSNPEAFKNAQISLTIREALENVEHENFMDILADICKTIPSNSAIPFITDVEIKLKKQPTTVLKELVKNPDVKKNLQRAV